MKWKAIIAESKDLLLIENSAGRIYATIKELMVKCIARTPEEVEAALMRGTGFKTIWLDYDLTRIWARYHRVNTLALVRHNAPRFRQAGVQLIVIHSWNPWGRLLLKKALKNSGIRVILKRHWKII